MSITTVLFDLDGTLLPMDQDAFVKKYFGLLAAKLAGYGYEPQELIGAIWAGTKAMVKNTGGKTNEEAFWESFAGHYGEEVKKDIPLFDAFYRENFCGAREACGFAPQAAELIRSLKTDGKRLILATNPLFPATATEQRIRWAGLQPEDFELYTTYENSHYCKPNPDYYREILDSAGVQAEECLMVGNDVAEDMVAAALGMRVFLLTDCLLNRENRDISQYPNGGYEALRAFLKEIG